jgi:hypothetical protein
MTETLTLVSYRARPDRRSTDFLVLREHDDGLGNKNRDLLLATGRFVARRRNQRAMTFKTCEDAQQAITALPSTVPNFPGCEPYYTVLTAIQWDEFVGIEKHGAPVIVRYRDCNWNLRNGESQG